MIKQTSSQTNVIEKRVGSIMIKTSNMERSILWYSNLLGVPVSEAPYPPIVSIPLDNTIILLDSLGDGSVAASPNVLFSFNSSDIDKSLQHLIDFGVEIVGESPERFPDVAFITIKDPDGHLLMIVQEF